MTLLAPGRRHDGLNWYAFGSVEKYSADQVLYANRRLGEQFGPRMMARGVNVRYRGALRDTLHACTAGPEDGIAQAGGNLLVTQGLDQITKLLIASGTSYAISNTHGICGVGTGSTTAVIGDVALTNDGTANAFYQGFDASNPSQSNGVMTGVSTFASGNANFNWQEWCWATSSGTVGASTSTTLHTAGGSGGWTGGTTQFMWNHKVPSSLGTKASGAAWVFTTTITLS